MNEYPLTEEALNNISDQLRKNSLNFYQFYNTSLSIPEYNFHDFKLKRFQEPDPQLKILNKTYYDIEIFIDPPKFPDPSRAERPVNAIATYNSNSNTAIIYYLTEVNARLTLNPSCPGKYYVNNQDPEDVSNKVKEIYKNLVRENPAYDIPDLNIVIKNFKNELDLIKEFFKDRIQEKTLFLIGFNSANFDNPYMINRLIKLTSKQEAANIVSEFGEVEIYNGNFTIPDYILVDMLVLYKPVDQGGGGFGKSLPNFKLNTLAEVELELNKLDLPGGFNENYLNNIENYLAYNLLDTLLVYLLDKKLSFMENQWALNNYNNSLMSMSMRGRSLIYQARNNLHYTMSGKLLRSKRLNKEVYITK